VSRCDGTSAPAAGIGAGVLAAGAIDTSKFIFVPLPFVVRIFHGKMNVIDGQARNAGGMGQDLAENFFSLEQQVRPRQRRVGYDLAASASTPAAETAQNRARAAGNFYGELGRVPIAQGTVQI